jgi:PrtD family type I secretion system ABC transporter
MAPLERRPAAMRGPIAGALHRSRRTILAAAAVSGAISVLTLTGSVYALKIYNVVLPARDASTLGVLTVAMLALYVGSGLLDGLRFRLLSNAAARLDHDLSGKVFAAQHALSLGARCGDGLQSTRDLDQIRSFLASSAPTALFDLPFMPLYLIAIFVLSPLMGALAVTGALLLVAIMVSVEARSGVHASAAAASSAKRSALAAAAHRNAGAMRAMGFLGAATERWCMLNADHLEGQARIAQRANNASAAIKAARPALQSSMLGLGAYLAISGRGSAGSMLAASIILARALAPVETVIAHWRSFLAARQSYARLANLLAAVPADNHRPMRRLRPSKELRVEHLSLAPPGARVLALRDVSFRLSAGAGLAVVGPSAAGKSTLARALVGVWPAQSGTVCIDSVPLCDCDPDVLGRHVGYVPQDVSLFDGTIADNIARFDSGASKQAIAAAARAAGFAQIAETLPAGYRAEIGAGGVTLSIGQRQRLALARALYGDPFLVVLDEPDANLDADGVRHLNAAVAAVRRRGGIVIVIAHRRSTLAGLDQVLALGNGRVTAFGQIKQVTSEPRLAGRALR